jgi:type IV pilus assembly protein PilM
VTLGIDIGTRTVTFAEMKNNRGQFQLLNFGGLELPQGAVRNGEIVDADEVARVIRDLVGQAKTKEKKVHLGVANQRAVVRQIDVPDMPDDELAESLAYQVGDSIPMPTEDAEVDFHVLDRFEDETGPKARLLIVAAHRDMLQNAVSAAAKAGLTPVGIDLTPFAMLRALVPEGRGGVGTGEGPQVLIDLGGGITSILVHERGVPTFVRTLVVGGDDITASLANTTNSEHSTAEKDKRRATVGKVDGVPGKVVTDKADELVREIRTSLDYYLAQGESARPTSVVITGGGALLRGLPARIEASLHLPVEIGNPLTIWQPKTAPAEPDKLAMIGPSFTTAIGLALGGAA